jgi:hypothetical protein
MECFHQSRSAGCTFYTPSRARSQAAEFVPQPEISPAQLGKPQGQFILCHRGAAITEEEREIAWRLSSSTDWGKSFGKSVPVDPTGTASQSFYALAVGPDGAVYAAWLDGRERGQGRAA